MAHLYKTTTWTSPTGREYCGDLSDLAHDSNAWWIPCRILGIAPDEFILLLKDRFNASDFYYDINKNFLSYSWENKVDAMNYKNFINKKAREANAII